MTGPQWLAGIGDRWNSRVIRARDGRRSERRPDSNWTTRSTLSPRALQQAPQRLWASRAAEGAGADAKRVADIARMLTEGRRGQRCGRTSLTWAEAVCASILSHQRDFDSLMPWAGSVEDNAGPDAE